MKAETIHEELQSIIVSYDYGIVPKSARVISVNDARGSGEVELGLFEGVTIVVSVSDRGFQIFSANPTPSPSSSSSTPSTPSAPTSPPASLLSESEQLRHVRKMLGQAFEAMDALLMAVSPEFRNRFQAQLFAKLSALSYKDRYDEDRAMREGASAS
ncbi:hypothetical protein BC938DRAFT_477175 [Jimgerdemannia flammicorona]|uniref:GSKIP domain-containing protein n=1 Tax=Jimgerdemannia flammicorona TaxID=994334 RepID=A0A433QPN3_9FUNG|nr:hypothetical protein BC938DRAFT_477175 [Jimgerdemannia flammicorona]